MKTSCKSSTLALLAWLLVLLPTIAPKGYCRDYLIYSVAQDLPMGEANEILRKNYYLNMGGKQGLKPGAKLNVYRSVSLQNPYDTKKRENYRINIGKLEVIHTEDDSAIAVINQVKFDPKTPYTDIRHFMIGDFVAIATGEN